MPKTSFIQKNDMQRIVLGIVYEPDTVDLQGDFSDAPTIEKACHEFNKSLQSGGISKSLNVTIKKALELLASDTEQVSIDVTEVLKGLQNKPYVQWGSSKLDGTVEKGTQAMGDQHQSWNSDVGDIIESYIMPCDCVINDQPIKKGTWMMSVQYEPQYFEKVLSGERTGFSMGGRGIRVPSE